MKKSIFKYCVLFAAIVSILFCIYKIRTANIILGSNTYYYTDIFDYPGSVWRCEKARLELRVYDFQNSPYFEYENFFPSCFGILKTPEDEYIVIGERGRIEMYKRDYVNNYSVVFSGFADYKRSFFTREVCSFTVYQINRDEIFEKEYQELKFEKIK